jgi:pSer/pThr/pTyr-binding forkhead associated (FHA) protein
MRVVASGPSASHAVALKAVIEAQRAGLPILVIRDEVHGQRVFVLESHDEQLWIGRGAACDVRVEGDEQALRCHAELVRVPEGWAVVDDGLSRNGTYVDGRRITGRRRLHDGEVVCFGNSAVAYKLSGSSGARAKPTDDMLAAPELTPRQRQVLLSLSRPLLRQRHAAAPATNKAIADELVLSVPAVVTHIRTLFKKFAIEDLPQNQKRARLAERAILAGAVTERDLRTDTARISSSTIGAAVPARTSTAANGRR